MVVVYKILLLSGGAAGEGGVSMPHHILRRNKTKRNEKTGTQNGKPKKLGTALVAFIHP
jgi:hypothetical protein